MQEFGFVAGVTIAFPILLAMVTAPSEYPAESVLLAFSEACQNSENPDQAQSTAASLGWKQITPDETTPFGRLVLAGRGAIEGVPNVKDLGSSNFVREWQGRTLYLALSAVEVDGKKSFGCRVYDFEATQAIPKNLLTRWAGREPTEVDELQGMVNVAWRPGLNLGEQITAVVFAPIGSLLDQRFGQRGLILRVQKLEKTNP